MQKSSDNPAFGDKVWERVRNTSPGPMVGGISKTATIEGTTNKTFFLLLLVLASSAAAWIFAPQLGPVMMPIFVVVTIATLVMTIMLIRNPAKAKTFAIAYALTEGILLGSISYLFESLYPNIVIHATIGTAGVVCGMLIIYRARLIRVTENFKIMVAAATCGIAFLYLISFVMGFFGHSIPFIHEGSTMGMVFSLFVIGVAAFNLAIDFDFIEKCEHEKAPAYMEWYGAFGLLVTIIWIYVEMLRLLSKSRK
jgi:uncharacterized YccA/Bax inhibitor family protein